LETNARTSTITPRPSERFAYRKRYQSNLFEWKEPLAAMARP
jgi:hypothetical protein